MPDPDLPVHFCDGQTDRQRTTASRPTTQKLIWPCTQYRVSCDAIFCAKNS